MKKTKAKNVETVYTHTDNLRNKTLISLILIIIILIISSIIFSIEPVRKAIISLLKNEDIKKSIVYEVYSNENNKIKMLLKFTDTESGIEEIQLPDGDKVIANGRNEVGIDYVIEADGEYTFVSKLTTGEEITETINVNEEFKNNLIGIEKIQEISTEQDYSIIKRYDGESLYTYYYAIGENNTEWIQIPEYKIVNVDSYKVNELEWKNEDGTVTLKVKKVGTAGNTVEVKKVIEDLNVTGIEFNEEEKVLEGESIIACIRDNELESGNYRLKVNGEEYPAEIYNYDENVNYLTDKNLGTREADSRMLIMKYNGNLTVNEERLITAETRKKGMFIYVSDELTNDGTIDMSSKGANAEGQNVYLWKNEDETYEYVPAVGATGGAGTYGYSYMVYRTGSYWKEEKSEGGKPGTDGMNRQTGGGGSGTAIAQGAQQTWDLKLTSAYAYGGKGGNGTSYSGGNKGKYARANAVVGGVTVRGEAGSNLGGEGGGLLIIYANSILNNGKFYSNGNMPKGNRSGGGSINIFYKEQIIEGTIQAIGGKYEDGGSGGNGTVTIQKINKLIDSPNDENEEVWIKIMKVLEIDSSNYNSKIEALSDTTVLAAIKNNVEALKLLTKDKEAFDIVCSNDTSIDDEVIKNGIVPQMTSNTSPAPFVVSATVEYQSKWYAWYAFDRVIANGGNHWHANNTKPQEFKIDMGEMKEVSAFSLSSPNRTNSMPKKFTIEGSNNGNDWTIIKEYNDFSDYKILETTLFPLAETVNYRYYRFNISEDNGYGYVVISEIQFYN